MPSKTLSCFLQEYYLFYWRSFVRDNFLSLLDRSNRESLVLVVYLLDFLYGVLNLATCARHRGCVSCVSCEWTAGEGKERDDISRGRVEYLEQQPQSPSTPVVELVCLRVREPLVE